MKVLRLLYVLLSLAVADLGWLLARVGYVAPTDFFLSPILFLVGIPLLVGGVVVSLCWLVSLLWLLIAYAPELVEVPPRKINGIIKVLLALIVLNGVAHYCLRPNLPVYKSRIVFMDSATAVRDSMMVLRKLCESTEARDFLSCNVRWRDSTLIFSVPLTRHVESLSENLGRIDTITAANKGFIYMQKKDVVRLLSVVRFLNRNLIAGIKHDTSTGFWYYPYGNDEYQDILGIRHLYIYETPKDTLSPRFTYYMTIKDRKEHMVLIGHKDVPYRAFR